MGQGRNNKNIIKYFEIKEYLYRDTISEDSISLRCQFTLN